MSLAPSKNSCFAPASPSTPTPSVPFDPHQRPLRPPFDSRLFEEINLAKGDGRYVKLMAGLAKADLLEILEDRYQLRSTLVSGQLPHEHWHEQIGDPTLADAIMDRLIHNAHIIQLKGGSMRKTRANLTALNQGE